MKRREFIAGLVVGAAALAAGARWKLSCPYCGSTNGTRGGPNVYGRESSGERSRYPVHKDSILCECNSIFLIDAPYHPIGEVRAPGESIYGLHAHNYGGHWVLA